MLLLGRVLSGFAAGLFSGAATATVLELAKPGQEAHAGFAATAANMGGLGCGPLLSGLLAQYAPWPLTLPFLVHLVLVALAAVATWFLPETVEHPHRPHTLRPQGLRLPPEVRGVFTPSAVAAFAGFSLLGLFTAVAPSFVGQTLGVRNLAVAGLIVFTVFLGSTAGQSLTERIGVRKALPGGCLVLVGLVLVAVSLAVTSLPVLVIGAVCGGIGQGLAFRAGLTAVSRAAPPEHRGGTISAFFLVAYLGISLPVVGVGALTLALGLRGAGLTFAACDIVLAVTVGLYVLRRPPTTTD
jgi:MFS family permease